MNTIQCRTRVSVLVLTLLLPVPAVAQTVLYSNSFSDDFGSGETGSLAPAAFYNVANSTASGSSTLDATGHVAFSNGQLILTLMPSGVVSSNRAAATVYTLAPAGSPTTPIDFYGLVAGRKYSIEFTASVVASTATDRLRIYWDDTLAFNNGTPGNSETQMKLGVLLGSGTSLSSAGVKLISEGGRLNTVEIAGPNGQTERTYRLEIDETGATPTFQFYIDGGLIAAYYDTTGVSAVPTPLTAFSSEHRYLYFDLFDNNVNTTDGANAMALINNLVITDLTGAVVPEPSTLVLTMVLLMWSGLICLARGLRARC